MPAEEVAQAHRDAPRGASALVVAIEKYDGYEGEDIPGSAKLAARFVLWLVERGVCPADRVTFMVSYDEAKYAQGPYERSDSPEPLITRLETEAAFQGVKILKQAKAINVLGGAKADGDFRNWISDEQYGPGRDDRRFVLFWIGHGHAIKGDMEQRVFLPCSDATSRDPYNVELVQLLSAVSEYAPSAHIAGFVQACRYPVPHWAEKIIKTKTEPIFRLDNQIPESDLFKRVAVLCAADHGQTTQAAGRDDKIFADAVLRWLENSDGNADDAISGAKLTTLVQELQSQGFWPDLKGYGALRYVTQPPSDDIVKESEWRELVRLAEQIDSRSGTSARVRWFAYCRGVGPGRVIHASDQLPTVMALFQIISRFEPRTIGGAPPLLIACDFVAGLADDPELGAWCDAWAADRGDDERQLLRDIRAERPQWLDNRPYVSITVEPTPPPPGPIDSLGHLVYSLDPVFFGVSSPEPLDKRSLLDRKRILEAAEQVIAQALTRQGATREDLIVEFVLPRRLLGWWLEYGNEEYGEPELGTRHPIVIRDIELARNKTASRPRQGGTEWRTCDEVGYRDVPRNSIYAMSANCLVVDRDSADATQRSYDAPDVPGQIKVAIDNGTPNVISIQPGNRCGSCGRGQSSESEPSGCSMLKLRKFLSEKWPDRLEDLPFTLRDMRREIVFERLPQAKVSVLTQDPTRIWSGFYELKSGYSPTSSSLGSGRRD